MKRKNTKDRKTRRWKKREEEVLGCSCLLFRDRELLGFLKVEGGVKETEEGRREKKKREEDKIET